MSKRDEPSFFRAVLDGRQYTYKYTTFAQLNSTPRQLHAAAMEAMLETYRQPQHKKNLFERMGVKEKPPQTKGGYVKNQHSEVLNQYQQIRNHIHQGNPYTKKHHPSNDEYQAASNIIGHTILVYTKDRQGHLQQANRFTPQGPPRGSPIVVVKSPQGIYTLNVQRTQHWSFYGAVSSHLSSTTAEQLYDEVKQQTRRRLQTPPQVLAQRGQQMEVEPLQNEREYLDHHVSAIPPAINPHELETLATILKRPIRTNPIMSMGYDDTIRNTIRVTPPGWTGSTPDLVVLFAGNHYQKPRVSSQKNRQSTKTTKTPELRRDVEALINLLEEIPEKKDIPPTTAQVYHAQQANIPDTESVKVDLLEQAYETETEIESVQSAADARRADVSVHDLARKTAEYITQHHPDYLPMAMKQAKTSPGLFNKLVKHTGSAVRSTGRSAKGVVDRSSLGDLGVSGIAIVSGLSVLSSYTSVWRVFFG